MEQPLQNPPFSPPVLDRFQWVEPPVAIEGNRKYYAAYYLGKNIFQAGKTEKQRELADFSHPHHLPQPLLLPFHPHSLYSGDHVLLLPADPASDPFIAKIDSLYQDSTITPSLWVRVKWYYRPPELEVRGADIQIDQNEIFASDELADHPCDSITGHCEVLTPAQAHGRRQAGEVLPVHGGSTFVCSRKYLPDEGRVVPLEDALTGETLIDALQDKPYHIVGGRVVPRHPHPHDIIKQQQQQQQQHRQTQQAQQEGFAPVDVALGGGGGIVLSTDDGERERPAPAPTAGSPHSAIAAAVAAGAPPPAKKHRRKPSSPERYTEELSGSMSHGYPGGSGHEATEVTTGGGTAKRGLSPRQAKETKGRWAKDRYYSAQNALVNILQQMGATSSDRAILRPVLRENARRLIGDTGLLDHLLKHLADRIVTDTGDKLRRRHDSQGHMQYWLQSPAQAVEEEEMLKGEMMALSQELREVKEARNMLNAVRAEAAEAIQAVSDMRDHPEEAARKMTATTATSPFVAAAPVNMQHQQQMNELLGRIQQVENRANQLTQRVNNAEKLAVTGLEDVRRDSSAVSRLAGDHVGSLTAVATALSQRVDSLEKQVALLAEEGGGRYEAIQTALCQMASQFGQQNRVVEGDVAQLKQGLNNLIVALKTRSFPLPPSPPPPPSGGGSGGDRDGGGGGGGPTALSPTSPTKQQQQQQPVMGGSSSDNKGKSPATETPALGNIQKQPQQQQTHQEQEQPLQHNHQQEVQLIKKEQ